MCGLVGVAGKLEYRDEALTRRLLMYDYFRGMDSTGFAAIHKNGDATCVKIASHPIDLFDMKSFDKACSFGRSNVFMGHNRAATKGAISNKNAHPYTCGDIVGAHNGTLELSSWNSLKHVVGDEHETDSAAIFECINMIGIEATVPLLSGAWSLVWYDRAQETLNFLRNDKRPMWFAWTKTFDKLIWSSDWRFIDSACNSGTGVNETASHDLHTSKENYSFFPTEVDQHYSFKISDLITDDKKRPEPTMQELKGKEVVVVANFTPATSGRNGMTTMGTTSFTKKEDVDIYHSVPEDEPFGSWWDEETFDELAKHGCSYCGSTVHFQDEGVVIYERDDLVVCPGCSGETTSRIIAANILVS